MEGGDSNQPPEYLPRTFNAHHALFYRRDFESRSDTKEFRDHQVMIVPMDRYDHGSKVQGKNNDGLHHDRAITPLSRTQEGTVELPSEKFVTIALALCDINEPLHMSHVDRFRNVRNELAELCFDVTLDNETRRQAWQYSESFSKQLEYMKRKPLKGKQYWSWKYIPYEDR